MTAVFRIKPKDFTPKTECAGCFINVGNKYLFLKRVLEKNWAVPAGKLEADESSEQAVRREIFEETKIILDKKELNRIGPLFIRYPQVDFVYHIFHQEYPSFPKVILSNEHLDYRWITLEEALEMPLLAGEAESIHHFQALL